MNNTEHAEIAKREMCLVAIDAIIEDPDFAMATLTENRDAITPEMALTAAQLATGWYGFMRSHLSEVLSACGIPASVLFFAIGEPTLVEDLKKQFVAE